jgi:glucose-1-phosphate thymidylyltransferase
MGSSVSIVGVVPAAGHARRLGQIPCSKELLPVLGRPVMDFLVERMWAAPCDRLRVVTRPEKQDVVERGRALGAEVIEAHPRSVAESLLAGLEGLEGDDIALVGFPDTVWEPRDGFRRLVAALAGCRAVLGLFASREPGRSDVVDLDAHGIVHRVDVKPPTPRSNAVWGCAAARVEALRGLERHDEPGELFDDLARSEVVRAIRFGGEMIDIGTPEALERARVAVEANR